MRGRIGLQAMGSENKLWPSKSESILVSVLLVVPLGVKKLVLLTLMVFSVKVPQRKCLPYLLGYQAEKTVTGDVLL